MKLKITAENKRKLMIH